jgi:retron-type reverse transcriptase
MYLEPEVERRFHPDSYGYRPRRKAHDALAACRQRCWKYDWVIDLDVQKFFDTVPWDLIVKAVETVTHTPWVLLYVKRWLAAPLQLPDGTLKERDKGTPQGALCAAAHNAPYEQRRVMYSVGPSALVTAGPGVERCA